MGNFVAGWVGILVGLLAGAFEGLFFHSESWRGGYAAWPRRMARLGHISLVGLGLINLLYALSVRHLGIASPHTLPGALLLLGAASMPLLCYLAGWRPGFRHLFFVPAGSVIAAVGSFLLLDVLR